MERLSGVVAWSRENVVPRFHGLIGVGGGVAAWVWAWSSLDEAARGMPTITLNTKVFALGSVAFGIGLAHVIAPAWSERRLGPIANPTRWGIALMIACGVATLALQSVLEARLREAGYIFVRPHS